MTFLSNVSNVLGLLILLGLSTPNSTIASAQYREFNPYKVAIIIGNNKGLHKEKPLRYAKNDAAKFRKTIMELGGYLPSNIHLMLGKKVTEVRQVLRRIRKKIKQIKHKQPYRSTILLLYYSGHADGRALHLGQTRLRFMWLRKWLEESPAQVRLAILDTCQSGQITRTKGARRISKEVPLPPVIRQTTTHGMALITSSGVGEDSHELDQLRGSIFTHYLVSGLRGAADRDRDGRVSLREAYSYAYQRTISHTVFLSSGIQHPSFRNELHGHGHLILAKPIQALSKVHFGSKLEGTYFVLNHDRKRLLAELKKERGKPMQLGLNPGRYTIVRRSTNRYQVQMIRLKAGRTFHIHKKRMVALSYAWSASKGMKWLTRDLRSPLSVSSPYRTAFFSSIAIASAGLVASGVLFTMTGAAIAENENYLRSQLTYDRELTNRGQALNTSAIVAISATGAVALSSVFFYLVHISHIKKNQVKHHHSSIVIHKNVPKHPPSHKRAHFSLQGAP